MKISNLYAIPNICYVSKKKNSVVRYTISLKISVYKSKIFAPYQRKKIQKEFFFFQLLTAPRCGVADIPKNSQSTNRFRVKRFLLGSRGWSKHRITY